MTATSLPEDWELVRLGDHFTITSSKRVFQRDWRSSGVPFYRARELAVLGEKGRVDNELFIDREMFDRYRRAYGAPAPGDFLVTGVGTLGKTYVVQDGDEFYFKDGNIIWFKAATTVDSSYLNQLYRTPFVLDQVFGNSGGSTVGTYTITNAKLTLVPLPPRDEQSAIAHALRDADDLITTLERLVAKKQAIKQGMMQQLLTGRTRLPGFTGEFKACELGDVAIILDNLRVPLSATQRASRSGPFPYCGANGILDYIDEFMIDDDVVLLAEDGGNFDQWATRPIAYRLKGKIWVNNHAHVLKATQAGDTGFLFYALEHKDITPFISSGTRSKLTRGELVRIKISMPYDISEQRAIAQVLTDIDDEISTLTSRLSKAHAIKTGMMQQLLTGRTRLPIGEAA